MSKSFKCEPKTLLTAVLFWISLSISAPKKVFIAPEIALASTQERISSKFFRDKSDKKIDLSSKIQYLEWSKNGEFLAIIDDEDNIQVFEISTGQKILEVEDASNGLYLSWNSDSQHLATVDFLGRLRIIDISGQEKVIDLGLKESSEENVSNIRWSPNGEYLAVLTNRNDRGRFGSHTSIYTVQVLTKEAYDQAAFVEVRGSAFNLTWSPDSQYIAASSPTRQSNMQILELSTNSIVVLSGDSYPVNSIEWSPNSLYLVKVYSSSAQIFDIIRRELVLEISHQEGIDNIHWSPDGEKVAVLTSNGYLNMLSSRNLSTENFFEYSGVFGNHVIWSPDSESVIVQAANDSFNILDASTGSEVLYIRNGQGWGIESVTWSPTGQYISTVNEDYSVNIFDADTGERVQHIKHEEKIYGSLWSSDDQYLATYTWNHLRVTEVAEH
ncbi:MAG: hypothetical protein AAGG51_03105 [Cyanobacteria bacterium P01_G01_bin.54]